MSAFAVWLLHELLSPAFDVYQSRMKPPVRTIARDGVIDRAMGFEEYLQAG
jgi:hypothetical protein